MRLPRLRRLLLRSGGLPKEALESLYTAELPSLESLEIWFGDENYGGCGSIEAAAPFLVKETWPRLKHLGLCNAMFTNELCEKLSSASILPQLEQLDLSLGTMDKSGAKALLREPQRFAHLQRLNLRGNCLAPQIGKRLKTLCPDVDVRYQGHRNNRYVTVGE